jgi:peptidyl-prolyl cis-trans isomerase-like 4
VQRNFSFQTGDPIGPGSKDSDGGSSIWGLLQGAAQKTFQVDIHPKLKHTERGTVSMATVASSKDPDQRIAGSQFIVTLGDNLDYLDGKAAIFGKVVEGFDTLEKVNEAFIDDAGRPLKDIRIRHTVVLDDPYPDPQGLVEPTESPVPSKAQLVTVMIADDEELDENVDEETVEKLRREREARAQALTLEMVGDLPFAEVKPPENVLFVCKLNPVTQGSCISPMLPQRSINPCLDDDLHLIFSRFGKILSCEVIRDKRTGDSLQYAFIEFDEQKDCEQAYFKMQGVLIDDHRIHVDFSQSVSATCSLLGLSSNSENRSPSFPMAGGRRPTRNELIDQVALEASRVSKRGGNIEQQMAGVGHQGMGWCSIRTRFARGEIKTTRINQTDDQTVGTALGVTVEVEVLGERIDTQNGGGHQIITMTGGAEDDMMTGIMIDDDNDMMPFLVAYCGVH